jgi:hypothetical protein
MPILHLELAELLLDRDQVGQSLRRVELVALHVDDGDVRVVGELLHRRVGKAVDPLRRLAVHADGDGVSDAAEHLGHVADALRLVGDFEALARRGVGLSRLEVDREAAQLLDAGREGAAGAQRLVEEHREKGLSAQDVSLVLVHRVHPLELQGDVDEALPLLLGVIVLSVDPIPSQKLV